MYCSRSPTLLPRAIATRGTSNSALRTSTLLEPPGGEYRADPRGVRRAFTEHVLEPAGRLLEHARVLERLAEHHAEHRAVPRVGDVLDPGPPSFDERPQGPRIVFEDAAEHRGIGLLRLP